MSFTNLGISRPIAPDFSFNADIIPNITQSAGQLVTQGMDFASAERQRRHAEELARINAQIANAQSDAERYAAEMKLHQLQLAQKEEKQKQTTMLIIIGAVAVLGIGAVILATSGGKK